MEDKLTFEKDKYISVKSQIESEIKAAKAKTKHIIELEDKVSKLESEKNSL